jgi:hypothetical protein
LICDYGRKDDIEMIPKALLIIMVPLLMGAVLAAGCTNHTTQCYDQCGDVAMKTSMIYIISPPITDWRINHIRDSDGIEYDWGDGGSGKFDRYNCRNVTFTYRCKNGRYEILDVITDRTCDMSRIKCGYNTIPTSCGCC